MLCASKDQKRGMIFAYNIKKIFIRIKKIKGEPI